MRKPLALGPLPLLEPSFSEPPAAPSRVVLAYHQLAFSFLHERLGERIDHALLAKPKEIRARHLLSHLKIAQEISPETAWPILRQLLDVLEAEMATALSLRSVFFWLHIYRRIGVRLHRVHEDRTDSRTTALVRQLVELAIIKHGRTNESSEMVLSNKVKPDRILGGLMRAALKFYVPKRFTKRYKQIVTALRTSPEWVVRDFTEDDFLNIYFVEGMAYQYWRIMALMRAVGKGTRMVVHSDGEWDYVPNEALYSLICSIDARTDNSTFDGTLLGTWFDARPAKEVPDAHSVRSGEIILPVYNVAQVPLTRYFHALGVDTVGEYVSNFCPWVFDTLSYLETHDFLSSALQAKHGYSLKALIATIWALADIVIFPESFHFATTKKARDDIFRRTILTVLQRGYRPIAFATNGVAPALLERIHISLPDFGVTESDVHKALDRLTLTQVYQKNVALWTGGPRYLLLPGPESNWVIDLQGVPQLLYTLFVGVAHGQSQRGTVFEEAFRCALQTRGYEVRSGRVVSVAGASRELDAGVLLGDELIVFECVSVEKPLDYEIGNPLTFQRRRERLDEKVEQVLTLSEFFCTNPVGRNYDFSCVKQIIPLVASPFVEWLWERSERLWLSDGTPRIVSPAEAVDFVDGRRALHNGE